MIGLPQEQRPVDEVRASAQVLLVSSQWGRRSAIHKLFDLFEARCFCAETAEQAIGYLTSEPVSVAVVDLDLEGFDGLTLIGHLWRGAPDLPVLVFGGNQRPAKRRAAALAGVSAQFDWPPDPEALMLAVRVATSQPHGKSYSVTRQLMATSSAIALHAGTAQAIQEFLDRALATLVLHFEANRGSLFTLVSTEVKQVLRAQAWRGLEASWLRDLAPGEGVTGRVFQSGLAQLFLDEAAAQPGYESCTTICGLSSSMSVPLRAQEQILGVVNLAVTSPTRAFSPRDLETLEFLAGQVGVATRQVEVQVEQAALRQQLQNAERLTVAGELTAGITHEIKSPLAYVQTNLHALRDYLRSVQPFLTRAVADQERGALPRDLDDVLDVEGTRELIADGLPLLEECGSGLGRILKIVQDLRSMMQSDADVVMEAVRLAEVIAQAVKLTRARVSPAARVKVTCDGEPVVRACAVQLVQIIVNLLNNAADAITERPEGAAAGEIAVRVTQQDALVLLEVEDNGVGMDEATLQRAFQPLFSTKLRRGGTGLGMGMVKRIVERHQGQLEVTSTPGQGTCIRVRFPHRSAPEPVAEAGSSSGDASR
ncbi:MAG: ATP-binding protein [Pseudomonadota bacterium]